MDFHYLQVAIANECDRIEPDDLIPNEEDEEYYPRSWGHTWLGFDLPTGNQSTPDTLENKENENE